jgi:hypothetical protein
MLTLTEQNAVAKQTLSYLGGAGRVDAMLGVVAFQAGQNGELSFRFKARANKKINYVKFAVNSMDLYDVTFYKIVKGEAKVVSEHNNYYFDQIKYLFESETGLYLSI